MTNSFKVVVLLAFAAATTTRGQTYEAPRRKADFGICSAELGGGIVGALGVGGTFAVVSLFYPAWIDEERLFGWSPQVLGGISGSLALAGLAGGTCIVGHAFDQDGKFLPTLVYATGTAAVALGLSVASSALVRNSTIGHDVYHGMRYASTALFVVTPFVGVYAYNLSRPRDSHESRFVPGSVGLASVRDPDGTTQPSVNVRLLSVKF